MFVVLETETNTKSASVADIPMRLLMTSTSWPTVKFAFAKKRIHRAVVSIQRSNDGMGGGKGGKVRIFEISNCRILEISDCRHYGMRVCHERERVCVLHFAL